MATIEGVRRHWKGLLRAAESRIAAAESNAARFKEESHRNALTVVNLQRELAERADLKKAEAFINVVVFEHAVDLERFAEMRKEARALLGGDDVSESKMATMFVHPCDENDVRHRLHSSHMISRIIGESGSARLLAVGEPYPIVIDIDPTQAPGTYRTDDGRSGTLTRAPIVEYCSCPRVAMILDIAPCRYATCDKQLRPGTKIPGGVA